MTGTVAEARVVAFYAGHARWCSECGTLRNPADFSAALPSGARGAFVVPCDECREERGRAARPLPAEMARTLR